MSGGRDTPYVPDVGVVAFVPDDWSEHWSSRHHVVSRLSRYFPVAWMEPPYDWRQPSRALRRWIGRRRATPHRSSMLVYPSMPWLPKPFRSAWPSRLTVKGRLEQARRRLMELGCREIVAYLWRPEFAPVLDAASFSLSCYHIDDEFSFAEDGPVRNEEEERLLARADQVLVHSEELYRRKGHVNPNTLLVPNGADWRAFSTKQHEPADLAVIPRPRIGYTGGLKRMLDWTLIDGLVRRHPEWSFVFVGGRAPHPEIYDTLDALERRPNVYFLGQRPSAAIPAYTQNLDVCTLPYRRTFYTDQIYPLKLHEYLASGTPAVGTPIRTLQGFSDHVMLAEGCEEWSTSLRLALRPEARSADRRAARQAVARQHDWNLIVEVIARTIAFRVRRAWDERVPNPSQADQAEEPCWPPPWFAGSGATAGP